jgi:hypothetical protein
MFGQDKEMVINLNYMHNYTDVEALQMLRMKRAPLCELVKRIRGSGLFEDSIHMLSKCSG